MKTWTFTEWWEYKVRAVLRSLDRSTPRYERARKAQEMRAEIEALVVRMEANQR